MTISKRVQRELVQVAPNATPAPSRRRRPRHTDPSAAADAASTVKLTKAQRDAAAARTKGKAWTPMEHKRFEEALHLYPSGPWKAIADYVGTKNPRQTMTHAQKCREKQDRKRRGLRNKPAKKNTKKSATPPNQKQHQQPTSRRPRRRSNKEEDEPPHETNETGECTELVDVPVDDTCSFTMALEVPEAASVRSMDSLLFGEDEEDASSISLLMGPTMFSSVDLWLSQSHQSLLLDGDDDATDLEDLEEISCGAASQECW